MNGLLLPMSLFLLMAFAFVFSASKTPLLFSWNGVSPQVKKAVKYIDRQDLYYWTEWHRWLLENATEEELWGLRDYPNSYVKLIAYSGLIKHSPESAFEMCKEALGDRESVIYKGSGCLVERMSLAEYFYEEVLCLSENQPPCAPWNYGGALTVEQKKELRQVFFQTSSELDNKNRKSIH